MIFRRIGTQKVLGVVEGFASSLQPEENFRSSLGLHIIFNDDVIKFPLVIMNKEILRKI